ncbi:MAG: carotene hydroxylase [Actinomycetota bacterium]|jgi:beta-carotene 3-hydroxylase
MKLLAPLLLGTVGFLGMEFITYVVHRYVMHGMLERLHRSHHRNAAVAFARKSPEPNDVFPLAFSGAVLGGLALGFNVSGFAWLLPLLVGVTLYGVVYTVIHDGVIHGRIKWMKRLHSSWTVSLGNAHREHHRSNGEPYGMLFPWITLRSSAPLIQPISRGSMPSQVPADQ